MASGRKLFAASFLMHREQFQVNFDTELSHWWFVARREILAKLIARLLPPDSNSTIVDVGCGTGGNIGALADHYRCVGIDPSAEAIGLACERFPQVQFLCGRAPDDLGSLAAEARLFLLTDVLEHVPDDFDLLSRVLAAARPGCHVLVTVPADETLWSEHDESHGHYRRYDRARLARVWQGLPVSVLLESHFNSRLYPAIKLARLWNRWRGRTTGPAGTDVKLPTGLVNRALRGIFAGESRILSQLLSGDRRNGYGYGVSLVAILRKEEQPVAPRCKPAGLAPDRFVARAA